MRIFACMFLSFAMAALCSCGRSGPASDPAGAGGDPRAAATNDHGAAAGDASAGATDGEAKPIALTDARLDQYLAYRKEWNRMYAVYMKETGELAKAVDSKSTDISKTFTVLTGTQRLGQKYEKELNALRAKYGFTEDEDNRLSSAIMEVVNARVLENPLLGDTVKSYRDLQAKGGEEKKAADEMLKGLADQEKQALAAARATYGDACVDVLSKRVKDLAQFQMDLMKELTAQLEAGKR